MSNSVLISESTLTDRYQTTIPDVIRKALHLHKREKIRYTVQSDGNVLLSRADEDETDPVLEQFLTFIASDMKNNPQHVQAVSKDLVEKVDLLVSDTQVDLDSPLFDEDE